MIGIICFELTEFNYICQFNAYMYVCLRAYEMWSVESSEPQSRTENISINLCSMIRTHLNGNFKLMRCQIERVAIFVYTKDVCDHLEID